MNEKIKIKSKKKKLSGEKAIKTIAKCDQNDANPAGFPECK